MTTGIHHVTSITANVQANVDFYVGFLGLRLVKQTGGYEDAEQLHLFYGDALGSPGTLLTFLVWEGAGRGRTGIGQVAEISLAVPPTEIGNWLTKALSARMQVEGPSHEFGETVLRLKDPDGLIIKLVGHAAETPAPLQNAPTRIRGVSLFTDKGDETADFISRFGYRKTRSEGLTQRMESDTDIVDIRTVSGYVPSISGAGVPDHVAFRAADVGAVQSMRLALRDHGPTHVHDRKYFLSLYVREPAGTLIEYATDAPGMTVDEPAEELGKTLMMPPHDAAQADELRVKLPQFALPGEERLPMRDLPFIHRFHHPEAPDGTTIVLLHGTGGNEADLMPLARRVAPNATLLGLRGRSTEEGINRWFRRFDAVTYDQDDIRAESEALIGFIDAAVQSYGLDPAKMVFLGYSNGANLLGAAMQLHPGKIRQAVLLRAVQALDVPIAADNSGARVLMLNGAHDMFGRMAPALEAALKEGGVDLTAKTLPTGHGLEPEDLTEVKAWL